jgi:hypothetical protein
VHRPIGFLILMLAAFAGSGPARAQLSQNPILFVTQMPIPGDFATIGSVFGNHRADTEFVGRGGDLYVRYADGGLRNLTAEAGFGVASGFQGANSIAVRDPVVHWSGTKAMFAMVVGAPPARFDRPMLRWQLYEVTGLLPGQTVSITRVPQQPAQYNSIEPAYASNGDVIFSSDRPRDGAAHLYPQLDEYESRVITTGLWRLSPGSGALTLLQHAPSGSFSPIVDSFGRVVFTRWDHLQRDQQNDGSGATTFNYASEAPGAVATADRSEVFPAPRNAPAGSNLLGHTFNQMFPWQLNQDGTEEETLNHLGRHELLSFFRRSLSGDAALRDFENAPRVNPNPVSFVLQMREDPTLPGRFVAIDAREFEEHASGQLIRFRASPDINAAAIEIEYLTSRQTYCCHDANHPDNTGHYRNPVVLSNGSIVVSHTDYKGVATNLGTRQNPRTPFDFRLKRLAPSGQFLAPAQTLTPGIVKSVSYYDPDQLVSYDGPFWELQAVEVVARATPPDTGFFLRAPELDAFAAEGVDPDQFRDFLRERELGVLVMRNVTTRDEADEQQPYNLRVPGGVQTTGPSGPLYDIAHMQFFQGDLIRGGGGSAGRRVLAQALHDPAALDANGPVPAGTPGASRPIHPDGSVALYVPSRRALAWQSLSPAGAPVVQERFWITVQPGEVRACDGCHGVNQANQAGAPAATNTALAFRALLARWKLVDAVRLFRDSFE